MASPQKIGITRYTQTRLKEISPCIFICACGLHVVAPPAFQGSQANASEVACYLSGEIVVRGKNVCAGSKFLVAQGGGITCSGNRQRGLTDAGGSLDHREVRAFSKHPGDDFERSFLRGTYDFVRE